MRRNTKKKIANLRKTNNLALFVACFWGRFGAVFLDNIS
jgi:hypothetical protein